VITSKAANNYHFKTCQTRMPSGQWVFYPANDRERKLISSVGRCLPCAPIQQATEKNASETGRTAQDFITPTHRSPIGAISERNTFTCSSLQALEWLKLVAFFAVPYGAGSAGIGATAQNSEAPRIVAHIDAVDSEGEQPFVLGWACQQGNKDSIDVRIFVDHAPNDSPPGKPVLVGRADFESDPRVNSACQDHEGGKHRFKLPLPLPMFAKDRGRKLYAEGVPVRKPIPSVPSAYQHPSTHPWVFITRSELEKMAQRMNLPNSYSANLLVSLPAKSRTTFPHSTTGAQRIPAANLQPIFLPFPTNPSRGLKNRRMPSCASTRKQRLLRARLWLHRAWLFTQR
jgi:hypothetical protein